MVSGRLNDRKPHIICDSKHFAGGGVRYFHHVARSVLLVGERQVKNTFLEKQW